MAQQNIVIGTADAKGGDTLFSAFTKTQANFTELFTFVATRKTVFVTSESDFLTQDATTITLESGVPYEMAEAVTTSKRFICENNSLIRSYAQSTEATLTYTGSGSMFSGTNVSPTIKEMKIDCPSGQVFDFEDTFSNTSFLFIDNITVVSCVKFGTFDDLGAFVLNRSSALDASDGISLVGSNFGIFSTALTAINSTSASFIAVDYGTAILQTNEITNMNSVAPTGAVFLSGLANSGNVPVGKLAMVTNCELGPDITPRQNIAGPDVRWEFAGNNRIPDSTNDADLYLSGGSATITVSSSGDWYEIGTPGGGVTWESDIANRFSVGADGVITCISERTLCVRVNGRATVEKSGGGADVIEVRIAKNWTGLVTDSGLEKSRAQTQNADPTTVPIGCLIELENGDTLRAIFSNQSGTSNIIATISALEIVG